ncbi:hypothetical protein [Microbacterium lacus]|uniref:hypothetical protein n=1 Tax=Microbacterium lacus TaxID=415217 RepID=UPI000C2C53CE|nr:hypothetical protein [Microbacterium lacus]
MSWRDRIIDAGDSRESWLRARYDIVGASDAKALARESSVESVLKSKLADRAWLGNAYTASGQRWEPMLLAWAGIPGNTALIHSEREPGHACTPDGILELPNGRVGLAEVKAKHGIIVTGPTLAEWRQVAFQLYCFPEADWVEWVWGEILRNGELRQGNPKSIRIERDHPKIVQIQLKLIPLADDLLFALRAARAFERELSA